MQQASNQAFSDPVSVAGDTAASEVFESLLAERHSCRAFLDEEVPQALLERILGMAQRTASWCNSQPWQLVITRGEATRKFREALNAHITSHSAEPDFAFPAQYTGVYQDRRRECGFQLYESVGVARGDRVASHRQAMKNFEFFDAPHVAIITSEADLGIYGAVDCGAYVSNFMLAARSCGVASIAQAALAGYSPFLREYFDIPDSRRVVCGISFGFADDSHPANQFRTRRASLDETVVFHT